MEITSTQLKAKQGQYMMEAMRNPVKISLRGRVTHVLLSIEEYEKLLRKKSQEEVTTKEGT